VRPDVVEIGFCNDTVFINGVIRNSIMDRSGNDDSVIAALKNASKLSDEINYQTGAAKSLFCQGEL